MFRQLLERLALALDARSLPYMLIGGQAVLLYGEPRLTRDIDVTLGVDSGRLDEVLAIIADQGWTLLVDDARAFVARTMVLPCMDPQTDIRIDFIFSFSPYEQQALERAHRVPMGEARVRFAAPEDLIIHKLIAGRPRDLEDVQGVLARNPDLDTGYIRYWLEQFEPVVLQPLGQHFDELLNASR
jgi:predicted nucleotidyltransferase